ncbi:MFS transporter [Chloroflexota bacterium]
MIKKRSPRIFTGWWMVLTAGILSLWGSGFTRMGFSAFFKPIASDLGFSRAVTSVPSSITRLEGGFEGPIAGWATDRFGPRWIIFGGTFLMGLGLVLMNYINSIWAFYVVWGVIIGTATNLALHLPLDTAISNWFVKKRGLALGVKQAFVGASGLLVPFVAWLITTQGWRMASIIGGLCIWFVCLPLIWFFFKAHRPEYYGLLPDGATTEEAATNTDQMIEKGIKYADEVKEAEFTLRQAIKTPAYWLLSLVWGFHGMIAPTINLHTIPFLTDIGIEPIRAAAMLSIMSIVGVPSRFFTGFITDHVKINQLRFLMVGGLLLEALGITIFLLNQTISMIYVWFVLHGIGIGVCWTLMSPIRGRYFGRKAFGSISGSLALIMMPIGMAAPVYAGWVYDTTGSYITVFTLFAGLLVFSAVLSCFMIPPKPPASSTDIRKIL